MLGAGVIFGLSVVGGVAGAEALLHFQHRVGAHAEISCDGIDLLTAQPSQPLFGAAEIEEQLPLRLGGRHLHDPPVAQDVLVNLGPNPVDREGNQAHPHFRVETLDRLHEADVAFLDEVRLRQAVAVVAAGDAHHETQV